MSGLRLPSALRLAAVAAVFAAVFAASGLLAEERVPLAVEQAVGDALERSPELLDALDAATQAALSLAGARSLFRPQVAPFYQRTLDRVQVDTERSGGGFHEIAPHGQHIFVLPDVCVAERSLGDGALEAEALVALANSRTRSEGPQAARPLLEEALARAEASSQAGLAAETAAALSNSHYWSGELRAAERFGRKRLQLATAAHDIFGLRHAHSWLALLATSRGAWEEARRLLTDAEPVLTRLASPEPMGFIHVARAFIEHRTGNDEAACAEITLALEMLEPLGGGTLLWYGGLAALIFAHAGRPEQARAQVELQEARLRDLSVSALPARSARAALGLAYVALGDQAGAARHAGILEPYLDDYHWTPVRRTLAGAAALAGATVEAIALLREAEVIARREGLMPDLGLVLLERGQLMHT